MSIDSILQEISLERHNQIALGFGPETDDEHTLWEWVAIVVCHLGRASFDGTPRGICLKEGRALTPADPARFRRQMISVAAVAVASIEALDRQHPAPPKPAWLPLERWQRTADAAGVPILVVSRRNPQSHAEGPMQTYAVNEEDADAWERSAACGALRIVPRQQENA